MNDIRFPDKLIFKPKVAQTQSILSRFVMRAIGYCYIVMLICLSGCDFVAVNSPYSDEDNAIATLYSSFSLRPKHLDPARSFSANEAIFTGQIYEPPYQYHYLKRPYTLIPLTAQSLPIVRYFDSNNIELTADDQDKNVAYSIYQISISPGILYQPHPAFVKDSSDKYRYHRLDANMLDSIDTIADFPALASRELVAADYVYQIKRLAHPQIHSPILGLMSEYIVGLGDYADKLREQQSKGQPISLRSAKIKGVSVIDRYTYQIKVIGTYPQLRYWLAMPFFAPIPWEADVFYAQSGLIAKNITLDWFPVGTGPYQLTENDPNRRMVLTKNPNYHPDYYPQQGESADAKRGLLADSGKRLPFIDRIVFTLEKESISYWSKFLQGYYDVSGISSDSFDKAIRVGSGGKFSLSDEMKKKGIALSTSTDTSTYYIGFNMQDSIVGGYSPEARKLRQAISIAIDYEEFISIFLNGRGVPAQGPIPPGIFGYQAGRQGMNAYVYDWQHNKLKRKSIVEARKLLAQAGYPNGRSAKTGDALVIYFDVPASGPDAKARFDWLRKQLQKLSIQLVIRSSDYNRFQDKVRNGQTQLFQWGWRADYPDPENFFFLLYGPNGKAISGGENAVNYSNPDYDRLFDEMRIMPDGNRRQKIIDKMLVILTKDAPWVWGFHPTQFSLYHAWNKNVKPNMMTNNALKYRRLDDSQRQQLQQDWNTPILWPLVLIIMAIIALALPAWLMYQNKQRAKGVVS